MHSKTHSPRQGRLRGDYDTRMRTASSRIGFYLLFLAVSPLFLVGYYLWIGTSLLSRNPTVSRTAQGPLWARFAEHHFGTRTDKAADQLLRALPGIPRWGIRLTTDPVMWAHHRTGYVPRMFRYPFPGEVKPSQQASARIDFFDTAVDRYLPEIDQFVILGAGFDTRAYRLPDDAAVRVFEVDAPATQQVKREALDKAGIDTSSVTFVSADFETDDLLATLTAAGFDPDKPTLFLWEGVSMYLDRKAVETMFRTIAATAPGSAVAFDYYTDEVLQSGKVFWRLARLTTKSAAEPLKFGIDATPPSRERLSELLQSCGLELAEQRTLGSDTAKRRAWGGFATAVVKPAS